MQQKFCQGKGTKVFFAWELKNRNQTSLSVILLLCDNKFLFSELKAIHMLGRESLCSFDWLYLPQQINPLFPTPCISHLCPLMSVSRDQPSHPYWPGTKIFKWPRPIKEKLSLGDLRLGEEWLQGEDYDDAARVLQEEGFHSTPSSLGCWGICSQEVLLAPPFSAAPVLANV